MKKLLTYKQYADSIGKSVQWIYYLVKKSQLKPEIIAGRKFIPAGAKAIRKKAGRPKNKK